jgi:hypothetical protein
VGRITPAAGWEARVTFAGGRGGIEGLAPGAALNASATFSGGAASVPPKALPGAVLLIGAEWSGGAAKLEGGTAPGAAINVSTTWAAGKAQSIGPGAAYEVSAAWVGGGASGGTDSSFASVSLLLPLNGADNSTTFTDASSNALTPSSVIGDVKIKTAQSKYGGASALFTPGSTGAFIRYTAQSVLQFPADFTIELWVRQSFWADRIIGSSSSDTNTQVFRLSENVNGNLSFYLNGNYVFFPTASGMSLNTWHHLAICRNGSSTRMFVDGVQKGSTNTTWTGTFRMDVIGTFFFNGSRYTGGYDFNGYIDDLRITKAARYTANFTPTGPHPTS